MQSICCGCAVTEELLGETAQPASLHSHLLSPQGLGVIGTSCSLTHTGQKIPHYTRFK